MDEQDPQRAYEQLKKEHLRALKACDVEALQRVQEKLDKLAGRERERR
jgi:hypothetical protein